MLPRTAPTTGSTGVPEGAAPVVHVLWSGGELVWWLERSGPAVSAPAGHPGAVRGEDRRAFVRSAALDDAVRRVLTGPTSTVRVLLPVRDGVPQPSPDAVPRVPGQRRRSGPVELAVVPLPCVRPGTAAGLAALRSLRASSPSLTVGAEVLHLGALVRDLERFTAAGRVAPDTRVDVGGGAGSEVVRATWRLVADDDVEEWTLRQIAALPAVLRSAVAPGARADAPAPGARAVLDEVVAAVVPLLVRERAAALEVPAGEHPLLAALLADVPLPFDAARVQRLRADLRAWLVSRRDRSTEVVLLLSEPSGGGRDGAAEGGTAGDGAAGNALWPLDVTLRIDGGAPARLASLHGDATASESLRHGLSQALRHVPELRRARRDADDEGRLWIGTATVLRLVDASAGTLAAAGVSLLLPREWTRAATTLRLRARPDADPDAPFGRGRLVEWNWSVALGDDVLTAAELAALAEAGAGLVRLHGSWVRVDPDSLARARRFVLAHDGTRTGPGSVSDLLGDLAQGGRPPVPVDDVEAEGWLRAVFDPEHGEVPSVPEPAGLRTTLRPYQRRGLDWLAFMTAHGLGAVLADDMGLGKTVQVLALLLHEQEAVTALGPSLLVCPMSLVGGWSREAARFAPSLRVAVHHGAGRPRRDLAAHYADVDLVLTTYGVLAGDTALGEVAWHRLVLDEAHQVKNTSTRAAKAVRAVRAGHRVALTGTPVENRLEELRGVLDAVVPGVLGSARSFRDTFARPVERHQDPVAISRLRAVTRPFLLRREKTDRRIVTDLPPKVEMTVPVTLTREQAGLYEATVSALLSRLGALEPRERRGAVLAALTRLKQICNHPAHFLGDGSPLVTRGRHRSGKLAAVEDVVETLLADGEQALLFTQFTTFGKLLVPHLERRFGVPVPFLHGGTDRRGRDDVVAAFTAGTSSPLLLLSLRAGGSGLNLTRANHVLHLDRWWNPAVEDQATDRAHRIGQQRPVQVRTFVTVGTVEERVDAVMARKSALAQSVVGGGAGWTGWVTDLDTDGLRDLLTLSSAAVDG